MGNVFGSIWDLRPPEVKKTLQHLFNWSREDVEEACNEFRLQGNLAVDIDTFSHALKFPDGESAELAFQELKNSKECVDWLTAAAVIILLSNQKYVSKVTCLFSLFDFNGDAQVNAAEFTIGVRYLYNGIRHGITGGDLPSWSRVESSTAETFAKIDIDKSNCISIEEIVSYAYMSKALRFLLSPFPVSDERIFEDPIHFRDKRTKEQQRKRRKSLDHMATQERTMMEQLLLNPGHTGQEQSSRLRQKPKVRKGSKRPWQGNMFVTEPLVWLAKCLFFELRDPHKNAIPNQVLLDIVKDSDRLIDLLERAVVQAGSTIEVSMYHTSAGNDRSGKSMRVLSVQFRRRMQGHEFISRVRDMHGDPVSLRALLCLLAHDATEAEIEDAMRWCGVFRAHDVLSDLLHAESSHRQKLEMDITVEDVEMFVDTMDVNRDGRVGIESLTLRGNLQPDEARRLVAEWDSERRGSISKSDLLCIARQVHVAVKSSLKALFANHLGSDAQPCKSSDQRNELFEDS